MANFIYSQYWSLHANSLHHSQLSSHLSTLLLGSFSFFKVSSPIHSFVLATWHLGLDASSPVKLLSSKGPHQMQRVTKGW